MKDVTFRGIILGVCASGAAGLAVGVTDRYPLPFFVGVMVIGPLAFLWFLLPPIVLPILLKHLPVARPSMLRTLAFSTLLLVSSAIYLTLSLSYPPHTVRESGLATLSVVVPVLAALAGLGWYRESAVTTALFHLVLVTWVVAFAFPYLGDFV